MSRTVRNPEPPEGFRYQPDVLPLDEEQELVARFRELPLKEFEFHGYTGKRRTYSYGWHYDFETERLRPADEIPPFLFPLREQAAAMRAWRPSTCPMR